MNLLELLLEEKLLLSLHYISPSEKTRRELREMANRIDTIILDRLRGH